MIPSIVRLVVSLFDVKETVPSPSIFGLDPCTLFCSMVGSILIFSCFNRLLLPGNPPLTYEQAQHELSLMRPETLWGQIEQVLSLYLTNWGETMPRGHTWHELAVQLHGESRDCFFLSFLVTSVVRIPFLT